MRSLKQSGIDPYESHSKNTYQLQYSKLWGERVKREIKTSLPIIFSQAMLPLGETGVMLWSVFFSFCEQVRCRELGMGRGGGWDLQIISYHELCILESVETLCSFNTESLWNLIVACGFYCRDHFILSFTAREPTNMQARCLSILNRVLLI